MPASGGMKTKGEHFRSCHGSLAFIRIFTHRDPSHHLVSNIIVKALWLTTCQETNLPMYVCRVLDDT